MRIFVYEHVTGGGFLAEETGKVPPSLLREGRAMVEALAADFAEIAGVEAHLMQDSRSKGVWPCAVHVHEIATAQQHAATLEDLAERCDWTVVIAPEIGRALEACCRRVQAAGGRLLGPGLKAVRIASDKHLTAEHLAAAGVPVPAGVALGPGQALPADFSYPAVLKPRLGAGSDQVRLLPDCRSAALSTPSRLERFCPGVAASVAMLCGPAGLFPLVPCRQRLSDDGRFIYQGGQLPLAPHLAERAVRLGRRAVAALPEPAGYLGVDVVLGTASDGRNDVVVEVNPRLTTSYVGLRAAAAVNLAAAMLDAAQGRVPRLSFRPVAVEFDPDGTVRERSEPS